MARFKQLDILTLEDEESTTAGICFNADGDPTSHTTKSACETAADANGNFTNTWEGEAVINLIDSRAVTVDLESISTFRAFINPNTSLDDATRTEITLGNGTTLIVNETLANFMAIMAVSIK